MSPKRKRPLVSVVTPVYNGADVIEECIESVLAQTYDSWEHVIVDNCSTDGTREIARRYADGDARIRLVTPEEFVGVVESGNRSLREISPDSTYTKVVHADDWLFPECLERMVGLCEENPSVGVVSAYRLEETRVTLTGLPHSISVIPGREMARSILLGGPYPQLFGSPSSLLIRSDLIRSRDPFYDVEFDIGEDYPFTEDLAAGLEILRDQRLRIRPPGADLHAAEREFAVLAVRPPAGDGPRAPEPDRRVRPYVPGTRGISAHPRRLPGQLCHDTCAKPAKGREARLPCIPRSRDLEAEAIRRCSGRCGRDPPTTAADSQAREHQSPKHLSECEARTAGSHRAGLHPCNQLVRRGSLA